MRHSFIGTAACLVVLASVSSAFAGEVLELRAGSILVTPKVAGSLVQQGSAIPEVFVAQWQKPVTFEQQRELVGRGFQVLRYLPQDALVLRNAGIPASSLAAELGARAAFPLSAQWKLAPELVRDSARSKKWVMVSLFEGADVSAVLASLRSIGGINVLRLSAGEIAVSANLESLFQVAAQDEVEWIQDLPVWSTLDYSMAASDLDTPTTPPALTGYESGTKLMGFDEARARGFNGKGQFVSMADTGVDTGNIATLHADLKPVVIKGYPLGIGGTLWEDPQGHGTHVCGSVVGTGAKSGGAIRGGAYEATMMPSSIWSPIMDNLAFPSDFNKLFNPPYADGARVHTNSWGSPRNLGEYDGFASSVDKFVWDHPDFFVLFAAGNSGEDKNADGRIDEGSIGSPATAKNVLSVGASENLLAQGGIQRPHGQLRDGDKKWGVEPLKSDTLSNNPNGVAAFSSRGPTTDGRMKPEIVAPGTNIVSTRSHHPKASLLWGAYDDEYVYAGGTSMATPLTAGAAVVARQYLVEKGGIASPSAALLKATMVHTAKDLFPGQYGTGPQQELQKPRPNVHEGYGRVDLELLTRLVGSTVFVDSRQGVASGASEEISFQLGAGRGFRATLAYTDAPASPSAGRALVNDIDLEVVTPSGRTISLQDSKNNLEMVEFKPGQAEEGSYRIIVRGKTIPQGKSGKQPYALVVSASE
jgi:subtilisin family serine protease